MTGLFPRKFFKKSHTKLLLYLVLIDLLSTMVWSAWFGVPELNPILANPLEGSLVYFVLIKLGLSLPGIYLLNKFILKKVSQIGLAILLVAYLSVAILHYYICINLIWI